MCNQRNARYATMIYSQGGYQQPEDVDYFQTKKEAIRCADRWAKEYREEGEDVRGGRGSYSVGEYHYITVATVRSS